MLTGPEVDTKLGTDGAEVISDFPCVVEGRRSEVVVVLLLLLPEVSESDEPSVCVCGCVTPIPAARALNDSALMSEEFAVVVVSSGLLLLTVGELELRVSVITPALGLIGCVASEVVDDLITSVCERWADTRGCCSACDGTGTVELRLALLVVLRLLEAP